MQTKIKKIIFTALLFSIKIMPMVEVEENVTKETTTSVSFYQLTEDYKPIHELSYSEEEPILAMLNHFLPQNLHIKDLSDPSSVTRTFNSHINSPRFFRVENKVIKASKIYIARFRSN